MKYISTLICFFTHSSIAQWGFKISKGHTHEEFLVKRTSLKATLSACVGKIRAKWKKYFCIGVICMLAWQTFLVADRSLTSR